MLLFANTVARRYYKCFCLRRFHVKLSCATTIKEVAVPIRSVTFSTKLSLVTMKFKFTLLLPLFLSVGFISKAQTSFDVDLRVSERNAAITLITISDNNIVLTIDTNGNVVLNSGGRGQNDYYAAADNEIRSGKLKHFENVLIDYYDRADGGDLDGKLRLVGGLAVKYYDRFDGFDNIGKLKSIGSVVFKYNDRFDGFDNRGKLKAIDGLAIKYYDRFNADEINGKLKSIGNTTVTYFDRFDGDEKKGRVKAVIGDTPNVNVYMRHRLTQRLPLF